MVDVATHRLWRQGDVLLRKVDISEVPAGKATELPRVRGSLVLAEGEATGHAHVIREAEAILAAVNSRRFLVLARPAELRHEEHSAVALSAGIYEVIRQRVWTDAAAHDEEERWQYAGD